MSAREVSLESVGIVAVVIRETSDGEAQWYECLTCGESSDIAFSPAVVMRAAKRHGRLCSESLEAGALEDI